MKRRVFIVRHGETEWNRELRLQGQLDVALSDVGRMEARVTGAHLAARIPKGKVAFLASDSARAAETCTLIADAFGADRVAVRESTRLLRERSSGVHEGKLWRELAEALPGYSSLPTPKFVTVLDEYTRDKASGGESKEAFLHRVCETCETVSRFVAGAGTGPDVEAVVIVSHGLVIRTLLSLLCFQRSREEGWEERFCWPLSDVKNASICEVRFDGPGEWWLVTMNETQHLPPKEGDRYAI